MEAARDESFLGTIADVLQTIESAKKLRDSLSLPEIKETIRGSLVGQDILRILELDQQALLEAVFEDNSGQALWRRFMGSGGSPASWRPWQLDEPSGAGAPGP